MFTITNAINWRSSLREFHLKGSAISPPNNEDFEEYYVHRHQIDDNLVLDGTRTFTLLNPECMSLTMWSSIWYVKWMLYKFLLEPITDPFQLQKEVLRLIKLYVVQNLV